MDDPLKDKPVTIADFDLDQVERNAAALAKAYREAPEGQKEEALRIQSVVRENGKDSR